MFLFHLALTVKNLVRELNEVTNWHGLGLQLDVPSHVLNQIQEDNHSNEKRMSAVFDYWVKNSRKKSWKEISEAVKFVGHGLVAKKVANYVDVPGKLNFLCVIIISEGFAYVNYQVFSQL